MGRHLREEHHFPGRRIQAASLILGGPPIDLLGQTDARAPCATRGSC